jgi:AcrR family transcriptional regulator
MTSGLTVKGLATKGRIVEKAAGVVRERGIAHTSLENIRDAAGVSNSQLFHYFPDGKASLLLAVAQYAADKILAEQEPHLSNLTTWQAWTDWGEAVHAHYAELGPNCDLTVIVGQLDPSTPGIHEIVVDLYERWESALTVGILSMQRTGIIRPDLDAHAAGTAILAGLQGGVMLMLATGSADRLRTTLRADIAALRALGSMPATTC